MWCMHIFRIIVGKAHSVILYSCYMVSLLNFLILLLIQLWIKIDGLDKICKLGHIYLCHTNSIL